MGGVDTIQGRSLLAHGRQCGSMSCQNSTDADVAFLGRLDGVGPQTIPDACQLRPNT